MTAATAFRRELYSVEESLVMVPISRSSLYRALARGDIRSVKIGKRVLIPRRALEELAAAGEGRRTNDEQRDTTAV